jgi:hypothetical protein
MPISQNIIIPQGLGPLTPWIHQIYQPLPSSFWAIVTGLSLAGGVLLINKMAVSTITLIEKVRIASLNDEDVIQIFFLAAVVAYAFPIVVGGFFDRYLVPLVPFVLYLSASRLRREGILPAAGKPVAAVLVAFTALFAVLGTRDYLMWHRVSWAALTDLQRTGNINAQDIDGGFEFNGWFTNEVVDKQSFKRILANEDAEYRIEVSGKPGFTVIKEYEYFNWMPPKVLNFVVLRRDAKS